MTANSSTSVHKCKSPRERPETGAGGERDIQVQTVWVGSSAFSHMAHDCGTLTIQASSRLCSSFLPSVIHPSPCLFSDEYHGSSCRTQSVEEEGVRAPLLAACGINSVMEAFAGQEL